MQLNEKQQEFVNGRLQDCKLIGIPGGGKTSVLISKVIHHFNSSDEFIVLAFTNEARNQFLNKSREYTNLTNYTNVSTLHKFANRILGISHPEPQSLIPRAVNYLSHSSEPLAYLKNLRAIFVDEAQDISQVQYDFILEIQKLCNCSVILVGDPNQNIYEFQGGNSDFLKHHPGPGFCLKDNYRSTQKIVNMLENVKPDSVGASMQGHKNYNSRIGFHILDCRKNKSLTKQLLKIIRKYKQDLAIIGPVKRYNNVSNNFKKRIPLSLVENLLYEYGYSFQRHYNTCNDEINNRVHSPDIPIHLYTIHSAKGSEFNNVLLLNYHFNTQGMPPNTAERLHNYSKLWYVAKSRAKYNIEIVCLSNVCVWKDYRQLNLSSRILSKLNPPYQYTGTINKFINISELAQQFSPYTFMELEDNINYQELRSPNFNAEIDNYIEDMYVILGKWANNYMIYLTNGKKPFRDCVYVSYCDAKKFHDTLGIKFGDFVSWEHIRLFEQKSEKRNFTKNYLEQLLARRKKIRILPEASVSQIDKELYDAYDKDSKTWRSILGLSILEWCCSYEQAYRQYDLCSKIIDVAKKFVPQIEYMQKLLQQMKSSKPIIFEEFVQYNNYIGYVDAIVNNTLIEFKFSQNLKTEHRIQLLGYRDAYDFSKTKNQLWNLRTGKIEEVNLEYSIISETSS